MATLIFRGGQLLFVDQGNGPKLAMNVPCCCSLDCTPPSCCGNMGSTYKIRVKTGSWTGGPTGGGCGATPCCELLHTDITLTRIGPQCEFQSGSIPGCGGGAACTSPVNALLEFEPSPTDPLCKIAAKFTYPFSGTTFYYKDEFDCNALPQTLTLDAATGDCTSVPTEFEIYFFSG